MHYVSKTLLNGLYTQTEQHLHKVIYQWQTLPANILSAAPSENGWSATQCLEHLNSYGRYYLPGIEKAINSTAALKPAAQFDSGWLGNYFYQLMLTGNSGQVKKKMKSPKNHRPVPNLNASTVVSEFITQSEKLGVLLSLAQQADLNKIRVPISIAPFIRLKLGDIFLFYTAHLNRHVMQAERAIRAAAKQTG